jgi:hypothetical protein
MRKNVKKKNGKKSVYLGCNSIALLMWIALGTSFAEDDFECHKRL